VPDIERMHRLGVAWAWFCSWSGSYGPAAEPDDKVALVYQSQRVVSLDELAPAPHQAWLLARFGAQAADPAVASDSADPDQDGIRNLLEYAFDTDPRVPNPSPLAWEVVETGGARQLRLTVPRNPAASDLLYLVEANGDPGDPAGWRAGETEVLTDLPALLVVGDTGAGPQRFLRLHVRLKTGGN
jgi:hypothetical protein